ncbi:MAG: TonB-dependent receptor, partial [Nitrospirales bacterium]|nr:TonB-dependent receptor [Nitrospirales bacterium]
QKGDLAETGDDTTSKWGIFVQESIRPSERWIIDMGIRYDQVNFNINDEQFLSYSYSQGKYITDRATFDLNKDFQYVSPRLGVVCKLNDIVNLYGNISTGFQTPQSSEISTNPNLDPMKVWNYETGVKARFEGGHSVDLSLFYMTLNDEIVQIIEPGNISSYSNAGRTTKKGVELSAKAQLLEGLFLGGAYTYSDFRFDEFFEPVRMGMSTVPVDRSGNRLPYIPEHQYSLFALYKHSSGFRAKVDTNTWGRYYLDNANSETYKGYRFLTNILVGYEKKGLGVTFDVYNLFDKHYAMEVTKDSVGTASYKPGAPRTWMARLNYTF